VRGVIVVFVVCVFPDTILSTFFKTGYHEASYLAKGIREITDVLPFLFILYSIFNKQFAKHTKELLRYTLRERLNSVFLINCGCVLCYMFYWCKTPLSHPIVLCPSAVGRGFYSRLGHTKAVKSVSTKH
jgi:hypothetical protein